MSAAGAAARRTRLLLVVVPGVAAGAVAAGVVVGIVGARHHPSGHHQPLVAALLTIGIVLLSGAAAGLVTARTYRRPAYRRVMQYGWSERRQTAKALRAGRPLDERQLDVVAAQRDLMRRQRWAYRVQAVLLLIWIGGAFVEHGSTRWLYAVLAVVSLVTYPAGWVQQRRFLRRADRALADAPGGEDPDR